MIPEGPLLWYVNRGTGLVLVVLFTITIVAGIAATKGDARSRIPRFAVQLLHRNVALVAMLFLAIHITTAVLDEYVEITWWQSLVPWQLAYQPAWLAAGILATDLMVAAVLTSLLRLRLGLRLWRGVHLSVYPAYAISIVHGVGIGSDAGARPVQLVYAGSVLVVLLAISVRLTPRRIRPTSPTLQEVQ